jgi:hypothetical protein
VTDERPAHLGGDAAGGDRGELPFREGNAGDRGADVGAVREQRAADVGERSGEAPNEAVGDVYVPAEVARADEPSIGFVLQRLLLLGTHVAPATLDFARGLNVITGSSDTGKSFAVECLDFMLGAQDALREIPQARAYDKVVLQIESAAGEVLTFERALEGGRVRCFPVAYAEIAGDTRFEELAVKHNPRSDKTLSFRLLTLCGLARRVLRTNARNETRTVSFRNVANLILVDEEKVITQRSPALSGVVTETTADKSLFAMLLTGRDDTGLVAQGDVTERRARLIAQSDLLDSLLGPPPAQDTLAPPDRAELARQREALHAHIDDVTGWIATQSRAIDAAAAESEAALTEVLAEKSRLLVIGELLSRFALLRRSYATDLERLEFIAEGHHFFNQLSAVVCPACSRPLDDADGTHQFCEQGTAVAGDVQAACAREVAKIRVHLSDLTAAVADLEAERATLQVQVRGATEHYRRLHQQIERDLRPRLVEVTEELKRSMTTRQRVVQEEAALDYRHGLLERKVDIERRLQEVEEVADAPVRDHGDVYQAFADMVSVLLRTWQLPGEGRVTFDERSMDIVVDGEARKTHGKGVRAIMYAAFVIGLMRYCRAQGLPHPGFVVLDSPLTTYRRRGGTPAPDMDPDAGGGEGEIPEDMQRAFFEHLATTAADLGEQIILFDNKEPPADVAARVHYEQFTGMQGVGRAGFIPA